MRQSRTSSPKGRGKGAMVNEKQKKAIQDCVCTYFGCCRPEMASFASKTSHCGLGAARANVTGKFSKGGKENKKTIKSLVHSQRLRLMTPSFVKQNSPPKDSNPQPTAYRGAVYCQLGDES